MKFIITTILLLYPSLIFGQEIKLFNPETFGKSIDKPVVFLYESSNTAIKPLSILTDIKDGKYYAATISYPKEVTFEGVKKAVKDKYNGLVEKKFSDSMFVWRNEKAKYVIQLTECKCYIQLIYIPFIETEDILKSVKELNECM